jgi:hypothetical protein
MGFSCFARPIFGVDHLFIPDQGEVRDSVHSPVEGRTLETIAMAARTGMNRVWTERGSRP